MGKTVSKQVKNNPFRAVFFHIVHFFTLVRSAQTLQSKSVIVLHVLMRTCTNVALLLLFYFSCQPLLHDKFISSHFSILLKYKLYTTIFISLMSYFWHYLECVWNKPDYNCYKGCGKRYKVVVYKLFYSVQVKERHHWRGDADHLDYETLPRGW